MLLIAKNTNKTIKKRYDTWYFYESADKHNGNYDIHYIFLDMLHE